MGVVVKTTVYMNTIRNKFWIKRNPFDYVNIISQFTFSGIIPTVSQWQGYQGMVMSSNENIFRVTGPLWGESTGSPVNYLHKGQWGGASVFFLRLNKQLNKQSRSLWVETPSYSLWRYSSGTYGTTTRAIKSKEHEVVISWEGLDHDKFLHVCRLKIKSPKLRLCSREVYNAYWNWAITCHSVDIPSMGLPYLHFEEGVLQDFVEIWLAAVRCGWPILWGNHCQLSVQLAFALFPEITCLWKGVPVPTWIIFFIYFRVGYLHRYFTYLKHAVWALIC